YLDLTFHHARQQLAPSAAKKAFAVGFGVVFASMILFTLLYADLISMRHLREIVLVGILLHMTVQCAFTAAAHLSVVPASRWIVLPIALAGLLALAGAWTRFDVLHFSGGEFVYRLFMAFYGLVAPAYVWIVGISSSQRATRRQWIVLAIVLLLATPFYWVAFIEKQMLWVLPGVAMVLISRLFDAGSIRHRSTA
ncbi:MAG TPA: hypothetical protein PLD59_13800, partial [Tepidisphaeraceae bacterium]|nr:hypothetical protein [Tepidisphaeraceae bacterium]